MVTTRAGDSMTLSPARHQRPILAADLHAAMMTPFGAATAIVVPVATIIAATAIATVVMAIAAMIVTAEIATVAVTMLLAIATIALCFGRSGGAKTERCEREPCGDDMRKFHGTSSQTRQSG
jgi:hypothetical protein